MFCALVFGMTDQQFGIANSAYVEPNLQSHASITAADIHPFLLAHKSVTIFHTRNPTVESLHHLEQRCISLMTADSLYAPGKKLGGPNAARIQALADLILPTLDQKQTNVYCHRPSLIMTLARASYVQTQD